jgi:hypothetical protein
MMMIGRPAYLTADCEAAKPRVSQVDGGGSTMSKLKRGAGADSGLSWRIPSMAMSFLDNDYNDNDNDDDDNYGNKIDSGSGSGDRTTKKSGGVG